MFYYYMACMKLFKGLRRDGYFNNCIAKSRGLFSRHGKIGPESDSLKKTTWLEVKNGLTHDQPLFFKSDQVPLVHANGL